MGPCVPDLLALVTAEIRALLTFLTLAVLLSWNVNINVDAGASSEVTFLLPVVSWIYSLCLPGSYSPRSFSSSNGSSRPG